MSGRTSRTPVAVGVGEDRPEESSSSVREREAVVKGVRGLPVDDSFEPDHGDGGDLDVRWPLRDAAASLRGWEPLSLGRKRIDSEVQS